MFSVQFPITHTHRKSWASPIRLLVLTAVFAAGALAGNIAHASPPGERAGLSFEIPWGNGPHQMSRHTGIEAESLAPMAIATDHDGTVLILDQLALRVVRLSSSGKITAEYPVPARTFEDLAVASDGRLVLVDRSVRQSVLVMDPIQGTQQEHSLVGPWTPRERTGLITSVLVQPDGVWLETNHRFSVRVLDADLKPCPHTVRMGRPEWKGAGTYNAQLSGSHAISIERQDTRGQAVQVLSVASDAPIGLIRDIIPTESGGLWVFYETEATQLFPTASLWGEHFDRYGFSIERRRAALQPSPFYAHRTVALTLQGDVLHMTHGSHSLQVDAMEVIR